MSKATLSNYDLTAAQLATAMNKFIYSDLGARQDIRRYLANMDTIPRKARSRVRKFLRETEDNLNLEKSVMITEAERLYEDALARLTGHDCAVVPGYQEKIMDLAKELAAEGEPPVPQALSEELVEHYEAIMEVTSEFLEAMESNMGDGGPTNSDFKWLTPFWLRDWA